MGVISVIKEFLVILNSPINYVQLCNLLAQKLSINLLLHKCNELLFSYSM